MAHDNVHGAEKLKDMFSPYLRTRQEALRIRKLQALYLSSLVKSSESSCRPFELLFTDAASLDDATNVQVPPELTGLRRKYLENLQANSIAKKALEAQSRKRENAEDASTLVTALPDIKTRLALLRERRRHERLQVLAHYLEKLSKSDAGQPTFLKLQSAFDKVSLAPLAMSNDDYERPSGDDSLSTLMDRLEKAVLIAKHQQEREERLVAAIKSDHQEPRSREEPTARSVAALSSARDELVNWVEEQLAVSNTAERSVTYPEQNTRYGHRGLNSLVGLWTEHYKGYVLARSRLLQAVDTLATPMQSVSPTDVDNTTNQRKTVAQGGAGSLLPFLEQQLFTRSMSQDDTTMQQSYLSDQMGRQKLAATRMLGRLGDESHLLPTYPYLAKEQRFQKAVSALNRRNASENGFDESTPDEMVRRAEAWDFASKAARAATIEAVQRHLDQAVTCVDGAQQGLEELRRILGWVTEEESEDQVADDIWAAETRDGSSKAHKRERASSIRGPWSDLNGKVGLISDGLHHPNRR